MRRTALAPNFLGFSLVEEGCSEARLGALSPLAHPSCDLPFVLGRGRRGGAGWGALGTAPAMRGRLRDAQSVATARAPAAPRRPTCDAASLQPRACAVRAGEASPARCGAGDKGRLGCCFQYQRPAFLLPRKLGCCQIGILVKAVRRCKYRPWRTGFSERNKTLGFSKG